MTESAKIEMHLSPIFALKHRTLGRFCHILIHRFRTFSDADPQIFAAQPVLFFNRCDELKALRGEFQFPGRGELTLAGAV